MFVAGTHRVYQEQLLRGYRWISPPAGYGAAQASLPLQSNKSQVAPESPLDRTGYRAVSGPVAYGAAQASLPLLSAQIVVRQEWPAYHPKPIWWPGQPLNTTQPLQAAWVRILQEWPSYHPAPKVDLPHIFNPVFAYRPARAIVLQEWPSYHPRPTWSQPHIYWFPPPPPLGPFSPSNPNVPLSARRSMVPPRQPITTIGQEMDRVWWRFFHQQSTQIDALHDALQQAQIDIVNLKNKTGGM